MSGKREIGDLAVSKPTRAILAGLREVAQVSAAPELELQKVVDVESAFAIRFHDDLVATWASKIPMLKERYGMTAGGVVGHTGGLRDLKVRGDYIGVARTGARTLLAIEKGGAGDELVTLEGGEGVTGRSTLVDWLGARLNELGGAVVDDSDLRPRLFRPLPMKNAPGKMVRHAKFGDGKVLREIGDGPTRKVQVDFYSVGLKMLQARFLEYVDEE